MNDVGGLLTSVTSRLGSVEARWVTAHALGVEPGSLVAQLDEPVSDAVVAVVESVVARRVAGEPLQYILGNWSFRYLEVVVDRRVLIPRPETEVVVDVALSEVRRIEASRPGDRPVVVADLGTGSGVIALSLAREGPLRRGAGLELWATDASGPALAVAAENQARLAVDHPGRAALVRLAQGPWFEALPATVTGRLDLVVSNPPYVAEGEWSGLDPEVRDHEPRGALVAGVTGREALEFLTLEARSWLAPGGTVVFELAPHQGASMVATAVTAGYVDVGIRPDLAGRDRVLVASWPGG